MKKDILIRLYGVAPFDRGGKVRWLLNEMGVKYEERWLDVKNKENEGPAYLKLNSMGRVLTFPLLPYQEKALS
jgi:glutathione S-transferase